eukprot:TRINITY_DN3195_c0_g1_i2.p2 TRINITY_DN3195_c0_g1~~TRINITY_DN3195_c0_g1_i2.p2  ORF type:complete len:177 (+),score=65.29 TRINITY_DN3195_c0_g1_i2:78-533(+)
MVKVGDEAPDFELEDQNGAKYHLKDHRGQIIVLYFYPKDETPGCTAEACSFRDQFSVFKSAGTEVVGISSDTVAAHKAFAAHHGLPFTLLSDPGQQVRKLFGVTNTLFLIPGRVTFVIDGNGVIQHTFSSQMNASKHVQQALQIVNKLTSK